MSQENRPTDFIDEHGVVDRCRTYLATGATICLIGPPGGGKTTLLEQLAHAAGKRLVTVVGSDLTPADLLGSHRLRDSQTRFVPGLLTRAMIAGDYFYIDEVSGLQDDCFRVIHSLIDHRREITITSINRRVSAHADFRIVFSYNAAKGGHDPLPRAMRDRLTMIRIDRLSESFERKLLIERYDISTKAADYLLKFCELTREVDPSSGASTRQLEQAARAVLAGVDVKVAARDCILTPLAGCNDTLRASVESAIVASRLEVNVRTHYEPEPPIRAKTRRPLSGHGSGTKAAK